MHFLGKASSDYAPHPDLRGLSDFVLFDMITLFDLITILLPVFGLGLGAGLGSGFGNIGVVASSLICGIIGFYLGRLPYHYLLRKEKRRLAGFTSEELRLQIQSPDCLAPNLFLMELRSRGEGILSELPFVLVMMESEQLHRRTRGFAALLSAYPEIARLLKGYNPTHPFESCKLKIAELRRTSSVGWGEVTNPNIDGI
jgi:hypothetical protein